MAYYTTLTQSWWYVVYGNKLLIYWIFPLSWSISTEMYFYIAYVAVVFLILLYAAVERPSCRHWLTALSSWFVYSFRALSSSNVIACSSLRAELHSARRQFPKFILFLLFYFSPYARVFEFLMVA